VVVGAEEMDWIVADAIRLFQRDTIFAAGAGAVYLKKNPEAAIELASITDSFTFTKKKVRLDAAQKMELQLPTGGAGELLCASESKKFSQVNLPGQRLEPKSILGEAFVASAAWQCVAACDALFQKKFTAANVSVIGANQQAIGARFQRTEIL
jgi:hypothetical protein